jgi:hypothetical protein
VWYHEDTPSLISGTHKDGIWRMSLPAPPAGSPQQIKVDRIVLFDYNQQSEWTSPAAAAEHPDLLLPAGGYHTASGAEWDGAITLFP